MLVLIGFLVGLAGVLLGFWWAPFVAGAWIGLVGGRARVAVPTGAVAGAAAWLLPLAAIQARYGLSPTAASLTAIMGLGGLGRQGVLAIVLTGIVGALLGLTGAWVVSAVRLVVRPDVDGSVTR